MIILQISDFWNVQEFPGQESSKTAATLLKKGSGVCGAKNALGTDYWVGGV